MAVVFIDMDCFYVAVERTRDARLNGKPVAVVQYSPRAKGGVPDLPPGPMGDSSARWLSSTHSGIIAVSYEARELGVTRKMTGSQARKQCKDITLVQVPTAFGKADLGIYKQAGDSVVQLLGEAADCCEKRSVDEVALDVSSEAKRVLEDRGWDAVLAEACLQSHFADSSASKEAATVSRESARQGHAGQQQLMPGCSSVLVADTAHWGESQRLLFAAAVVASELRARVLSQLGFSCSGGIAPNKMMAKLGCGLHKPNQQTIVPPGPPTIQLLRDLPLNRVRWAGCMAAEVCVQLPGLGGQLGEQVMAKLQLSTAGDCYY